MFDDDPKAVALTERNAGCPRSRTELLAWFPDNTHLPTLMALGAYEDYPTLWNEIINYNIGCTFWGCAWVTRSGRVWTCGWAQHEQLLRVMGLELQDVERAGWLRVSAMRSSVRPPNGHICNRASPKQKAFAKRHNVTLFEMREDDPIIATPLIDSYELARVDTR